MKTLKDLAAQYTWQPIETAPKNGLFEAWRLSANGPCVVFNNSCKGLPGSVCEPISGRTWVAKYWRPLSPHPTEPNPITRIIEVTEQLAGALKEADIATEYMGADARIGLNAALAAYTALVKELGVE